MTKKHFIALADVVRSTEPLKLNQKDSRASAEHRQWEIVRDALADFCMSQNGRFNRSRWLAYIAGECGPNGGDIKKPKTVAVRPCACEWTLDQSKVIRNPGKFEGEMYFVPALWDSALNGLYDHDAGNVFFFELDENDKDRFPELAEDFGLALEESEQGFVTCTVFETEEEYQKARVRCEETL
jgi:hypothetical protein